MKVWHDDVRKPPSDWAWVRTNEGAKIVLSSGLVKEISLDHDLGLEHIDPDMYESRPEELWILRGSSENGDGRDLVRWMVETNNVPERVTIHSWNPSGAKEMADILNEAGYDCTISPFNPGHSWR